MVSVPLALFDGDDALLVHLAHGFGDEGTYRVVVVGRNGRYLLDFLDMVAHLLALFAEVLHNGCDGLVDTPLEVHRVRAGGHVLDTHADDGLGEHRGGGGTVAGVVIGLGGYLLDNLGTHVGEGLFEFHFLGYRHTVLGDVRRTELAVDYHIPSFRAERYLYRIGERIDALFQKLAGFRIVFYLFSHGYMIYLRVK